MLSATKKYAEIPFAHRQHTHTGHCSKIHGHGWSFAFEFQANSLDENGFVIDFGSLKWLREELEVLDHALVLGVNDPLVEELSEKDYVRVVIMPDASCEGIAQYLFKLVYNEVRRLTNRRVWLHSIEVWEDSRNSVKYTSDVH